MPISSEREYRNIDVAEMNVTSDETEKIVEGYAATFNQPYELIRAKDYIVSEQIAPNAFDKTDMSDVIMQYDHQGRVFARSGNGTLTLSTDEHGLKIRADLGGTEIGRQLYEEIKGGYTDKMSFGFTVESDEKVQTETDGDGLKRILRTITGIRKLYDVSAVSLPANDATEISARSFGEGVIAEAEKECLAFEERQRKITKIKIMLEVSE